MEVTRRDLNCATDLEAIDRLLNVEGLKLLDVGCASGAQDRELVARGATVLGVEPDPVQATKNRIGAPLPGLEFAEARAQALPVESHTVDGVFFFRSLHHVPIDAMDAALREAARVLRRRGFLWVVEPGMTGAQFQLMRPFHDETVVRSAAQAALARNGEALFESVELFRYVVYPRHRDFETFVAHVTGQSFNNITRDQVETEVVRRTFDAGRTPDGDYVFDQPMLLNFYRVPKVC